MRVILSQAYSFKQLGCRNNQEDARYPDCDVPDIDNSVFIVCDGVGGRDCGEVASDTVCKAFAEYLEDEDLDMPFSVEDFQLAFGHAYKRLFQKMDKTNAYSMATTLAFLIFHADGCTIAHMGDSRVYHVRPGLGLLYRTSDHSVVNEMVVRGELTPEEAETSDIKNYITRCFAYVDEDHELPEATLYQTNDIHPGDYFFLCSDGVLDCVPDSELVQLLMNPEGDVAEKMHLIADVASRSHDNNTAIMVQVRAVADCDELKATGPIDVSPIERRGLTSRLGNFIKDVLG